MNISGTQLSPADFEQLAQSGIGAELCALASLRRVDSETGSNIVGRNGNGDYAGIVFPYIWPGENHVREYRLRRDNPEYEKDSNGKTKAKGKYLSPPGRGNMLYFVPATHPKWLEDPNVPIVLTEGEKKAIVVFDLGQHGLGDSAETPWFIAAAFSGVWNWRGTVAKSEGPNGERVDVKGPIPDLDRVVWKNRRVLIIFDSDVRTNDTVKAARSALAFELKKRCARVLSLDIPQESAAKGIDDLVGKWGQERVLELLKTGLASITDKSEAAGVDPFEAIPDIYSEDENPTKWVIEDLLAEGTVTAITGPSGLGKSTLVTAAAISIQSGSDFLGRRCSQRQVVVLDRENPKHVIQERCRRLGISAGSGLKVWGHWYNDGPPDPSAPEVLNFAKQCEPPPVFIVDSLIAWLNGDENDSATMRNFMHQLRKLADVGATVIVIHHTGKGESSRDYRGSSDFPAAIDLGIKMTNLGGRQLERLKLEPFKARFTVNADIVIRYEDGAFRDEQSTSVVFTTTSQLEVLLNENPGITGKRFEELATQSKLSRDRARDYLRNGVKAGSIRQHKTGLNNSRAYFLIKGDQYDS